jgi:hypothetical protein
MQHIQFDDFQVWEGKCAPEDGPFSTNVEPIIPSWPEFRTDLSKATTLKTTTVFNKAFVGGGCGGLEIENTGTLQCDGFEAEINVRPSWGAVLNKNGALSLSAMELIDKDEAAGAII